MSMEYQQQVNLVSRTKDLWNEDAVTFIFRLLSLIVLVRPVSRLLTSLITLPFIDLFCLFLDKFGTNMCLILNFSLS